MKRTLIFLLAWHAATSVFAQPVVPVRPAPGQPIAFRPAGGVDPATGVPVDTSALIRFDLDFPGGTPAEFIAAVSKARARPVNAIIPEAYAGTHLPAIHVKGVNIVQLFQALEAASRKTIAAQKDRRRPDEYDQFVTSFGFRTKEAPSDEAIWYFYKEEPVTPPEPEPYTPQRRLRYFQLGPYLETYKLEDITTAIETGWKMHGLAPLPEMKFHADTKLLIAVGTSEGLEVISQVLQQLEIGKVRGGLGGTTPSTSEEEFRRRYGLGESRGGPGGPTTNAPLPPLIAPPPPGK
ncbi:MAG: hypothetical protein IPM17_10495 [Verrucomicrobia bacterium]|nr:hypothetical protein [Verrucomicrobiota bacterium]